MSRGKLTLLLATTIALYALLFPLFRQTLNWQTSDFTACYRAGQMVTAGQGAQVYDYDAASNYGPALEAQMAATHQHLVLKRFVSAPFILLIFAPLSYLSHYHAEIVWYVLNVCLMLAWPLLLLNVLKGRVLVFALLGPVFFIPVVVGMVQGQTSTLTLFLFALCYVSLREGRPVLAGCALAMAAIKPQFVIPALLVLALCKYWKAVGSFFATSLGLLALSSLLVGWRTALSYPAAWIRFNVLPKEMLGAHVEGMPNIRGMLYVLLHSRVTAAALLALTIAVTALLLGMLLWAVRRRPSSSLLVALLVSVTLLASYYCYMFDLSLLMLAFVLVGSYGLEHHLSPACWMMLAVIAYFYVIPFFSPSLERMMVYFFFGMVALAGTVSLEILGRSRHRVSLGAPALAAPSGS